MGQALWRTRHVARSLSRRGGTDALLGRGRCEGQVEPARGPAWALPYCRRKPWERERPGPGLEVLPAASSPRESRCLAGGHCSEASAVREGCRESSRFHCNKVRRDSERPASASEPPRQRETALGCASAAVSSPQNHLPSLALRLSLHGARGHRWQYNVDSHHGTLALLGFWVFLKGSGITLHNELWAWPDVSSLCVFRSPDLNLLKDLLEILGLWKLEYSSRFQLK